MKDQHYQQHKLFVPQLPHKSTTTFLYYQTFFKLYLSGCRHLTFTIVWRFVASFGAFVRMFLPSLSNTAQR
jgi:hypothetical protein